MTASRESWGVPGEVCQTLLVFGITVIVQLLAAPVLSQEAATATGSLSSSASLAIQSIIDAAVANAPQARSEANLRDLAVSHDALGESLISGRPSWQASYIDDSLLDDAGLREAETGVSFNLWRSGERADTRLLGDRYEAQLDAWQGHLRLAVAGQVRTALADLAEAEKLLEISRQASDDAQRLVEITSGMESAGAASQADVLQARTQLLQQRQVELDAETGLGVAEQRYEILTGLAVRPAEAFTETLDASGSISASHPTLQFLRSQVEIATADVALTRHDASGRPNMSVGVRRERGGRLQPYIDSFGVSVSVPFGKNPAAAASVSVARTAQVDAEIRLLETRRQLERRLRELSREMALIEESLNLGQERVAISGQRYAMALSAFEVGESDLTQVVIAQQQARQAQRDYESVRLRQQRLVSEYNQTIGVIP